MEIKGGSIVLYCKTRWTTAFRSVDDIIRLKPVLENVCNLIFKFHNPYFRLFISKLLIIFILDVEQLFKSFK